MSEQQSFLMKNKYFILLSFFIGIAMFIGFDLVLKIPLDISLAFSAVITLELLFTVLLSFFIFIKIESSISELRFNSIPAIKKLFVAALLLLFFAYLFYYHSIRGFWFFLLVTVVLVYFVSIALPLFLLKLEDREILAYDFTKKKLSFFVTWFLFIFLATLFVLGDFFGGINWWYSTYVTKEVHQQVQKRTKFLKSIHLTHLYDARGRYVGLYAKTVSDWIPAYNDPDILKWKVSRAIAEAEGSIKPPPWWWKYFPDGDTLSCEPFSIFAFLKAPYYFITQRRKVGGSTPVLQAAKNLMDFGKRRQGKSFLPTVRIKLFEEMPRAYVMCQLFTPQQVMGIFQATLWAGYKANYGLHRLALYYFGTTDLKNLTWNQAVVLAASLPNTSHLNPWFLESCLTDKCSNERQARTFRVWLKRINQIKQRLRRKGYKISDGLPTFKNGLKTMRAISTRWKEHDIHLRRWIIKDILDQHREWKEGASVQVTYDRELTVGKQTKPQPPKSQQQNKKEDLLHWKPKENNEGLIQIARAYAKQYREDIPNLQISYSLIEANTGRVVSQYGGDKDFDMSMSYKPVFGSVFKVITSMLGNYWPDDLPILNRARLKRLSGKCREHPENCTQRRLFYFHNFGKPHSVRNSHHMPAFMTKEEALAHSANIGFVFFSLRWTWLVSPEQWPAILRIGLTSLYKEKRNLSQEDLKNKIEDILQDPKRLRWELIRYFGYQRYLKNSRPKAIFEAAKAATIRLLLKDSSVDKKQLSVLLGAMPNESLSMLDSKITQTLEEQKNIYRQKFSGDITLEELSWVRDFRMEIGLRYLVYLADKIAGLNSPKNHLKPVMTMTLGVNDATTRQLASIASFVASKQIIRPYLLYSIIREKEILYRVKPQKIPSPVPTETIEAVQKAMRRVLVQGTARRAGTFLKQRYDEKIFEISGAKTGTVQRSKGVSCIGFIGNLAGAVTISTPQNQPLKVYRIRRRFRNKIKYYEKRIQRMEELLDRTSSARRRRRYQRRIQNYRKKLNYYENLIAKYKKLGKIYREESHQLTKLKKRYTRESRFYRRYRARARRYRRLVRYYGRLSKRYRRKYRRFLGLMQRYSPNSRRYRNYKRRYLIEKRRWKRYFARYVKWQRLALHSFKKYRTHYQYYKNIKWQYSRLVRLHRTKARQFYRSHERWSLSSSRACLVLFTLLSYWKEHPVPPVRPIHYAALEKNDTQRLQQVSQNQATSSDSSDAPSLQGTTEELPPLPKFVPLDSLLPTNKLQKTSPPDKKSPTNTPQPSSKTKQPLQPLRGTVVLPLKLKDKPHPKSSSPKNATKNSKKKQKDSPAPKLEKDFLNWLNQ